MCRVILCAFAVGGDTDDFGAVFGVAGKETTIDNLVLARPRDKLCNASNEGLRREAQDAEAIAEGALHRKSYGLAVEGELVGGDGRS